MKCPKCKHEVEMLKFTTTGVMCRDCHESERKGTPAVAGAAICSASPSDREIRSMLFRLWRSGLNRQITNICGCLASRLRIKNTPEFRRHVKSRLDAMAKAGDLTRKRFPNTDGWEYMI